MTLYGKLLNREQEGNPIKVGVIGAGQMGFGMISQISTIPVYLASKKCIKRQSKM